MGQRDRHEGGLRVVRFPSLILREGPTLDEPSNRTRRPCDVRLHLAQLRPAAHVARITPYVEATIVQRLAAFCGAAGATESAAVEAALR